MKATAPKVCSITTIKLCVLVFVFPHRFMKFVKTDHATPKKTFAFWMKTTSPKAGSMTSKKRFVY